TAESRPLPGDRFGTWTFHTRSTVAGRAPCAPADTRSGVSRSKERDDQASLPPLCVWEGTTADDWTIGSRIESVNRYCGTARRGVRTVTAGAAEPGAACSCPPGSPTCSARG